MRKGRVPNTRLAINKCLSDESAFMCQKNDLASNLFVPAGRNCTHALVPLTLLLFFGPPESPSRHHCSVLSSYPENETPNNWNRVTNLDLTGTPPSSQSKKPFVAPTRVRVRVLLLFLPSISDNHKVQ